MLQKSSSVGRDFKQLVQNTNIFKTEHGWIFIGLRQSSFWWVPIWLDHKWLSLDKGKMINLMFGWNLYPWPIRCSDKFLTQGYWTEVNLSRGVITIKTNWKVKSIHTVQKTAAVPSCSSAYDYREYSYNLEMYYLVTVQWFM